MEVDLFAGVPVSNLAAAQLWYEKLFGLPPAFLPNDAEAVWEIAPHRYLFIEHKPDSAGHARHLIFVENLDTLVTGIAQRGLEPAKRETYSNGVHKTTFSDLDGNEIGFGGS